MFLNDANINEGLTSASQKVNIIQDGLKNIATMLDETMNPKTILSDAAKINNAVADMTTKALGQGRVISNALTDTMAQANVQTLKFGVGTEENLALFSAINNEIKNTKILTEDQIVNMAALAKIAGLTNEDMAKFAVNFDTLGLGIDQTVEKISELQREARGYGINVGQFMRTVGDNIKLVASFNFKGGVDGLAKMVAQAQSLRINMSNTVQFAEDLLDPSKAIETAAGFQMLGGAVGKLGDPFQLLHMAQTDMAGLQDSLVDMAAASVTFNEETGEFDIPVTEMYRLREAADLAGMGYQEFAEMALNSAKKTKKLEFLEGIDDIPEEQKEMIANLGELKDGRLQISVPGQDEMTDVANLTGKEIAKLSSLQEDMGKSDKQLAAESVGILQQINNNINSLAAIPEAMVIEDGSFIEITDRISESVGKMTDVFTEKMQNINFEGMITETFDKLIPPDIKDEYGVIFDGVQKVITALTGKIEDIDFEEQLKDLRITSEITDAEFNNANVIFNRSNIDENAEDAGDLVVTSQGDSYKTAVDDYIFAISEQNLGNLTDTISNLSLNQSVNTTVNPENVDVNVGGTITVNIAGTETNMSQEELNNMVRNNPTLMASIMKQLTGSENNFGGTNSYIA